LRLNVTRPFAAYLRDRLDLTPDQEEIALFGLQTILYPVVTLIFVLLTGWALGCLPTTAAALLTLITLRHFSHGAHSGTPLTCTLVSIIVLPLLGKLAAITAPYLTLPGLLVLTVAGFALSLVIVWRLAPADSPAKPVTSPAIRRRLRLASVIVACAAAAVQIALLLSSRAFEIALAMGLGLWWQAFALTGAGHQFATLLDNLASGKEGEPNETPSV
jgi:accessory gene regulator B